MYITIWKKYLISTVIWVKFWVLRKFNLVDFVFDLRFVFSEFGKCSRVMSFCFHTTTFLWVVLFVVFFYVDISVAF